MTDVVNKTKRSQMMSSIKGKDTKPELLIRKALHKRGFRYKVNDKSLPGKPDLVFPKFNAVILVNGCFWHRHNCHIFKWPSSRKEFWKQKIQLNVARDDKNLDKLHAIGWKTLIVWECSTKGSTKLQPAELIKVIENWIVFDPMNAEIVGRKNK